MDEPHAPTLQAPPSVRLCIESAGPDRVATIKAIHTTIQQGLSEAKQLADTLPRDIEVPTERAAIGLWTLRAAGAAVTLRLPALPAEEHALALAVDARTPLQVLSLLALHQSAAVQEAVAQNPNLSPELLFSLGAMFPEALRQNAIVPLWLLERPNFWHSYSASQLSFLAHPQTPRGWLASALEHPSPKVRALLAANPALPVEFFWRLAQDPFGEVRQQTARNPAITPLLQEFAEHQSPMLRAAAARSVYTGEGLLAVLARDPEYQVRAAYAARDEHTLPELERLLRDPGLQEEISAASKCKAAADPRASRGLLLLLAQTNSPEQLLSIARNPAAPLEVLLKAARRPAPVQAALARHPRFTAEVVRKLSQRKGALHRTLAALSPLATKEQLYQLSDTSDQAMQQTIVSAPRLEAQLLAELAQDPSPYRRCIAAQHAALPECYHRDLAADAADEVREALCQQPLLSSVLLEALSKDASAAVRAKVAKHPRASVSAKITLLFDPESAIRRGLPRELEALVAASPSLPREQLERLFRLHGKHMGRLMLLHPNLPIEILRQVIEPEHGYNPMNHPSRLREHPYYETFLERGSALARQTAAAQHPAPMRLLRRYPNTREIMLGVAQNSATPWPKLLRLLRSSDTQLRAAVAENPKAPIRSLWGLFHERQAEVLAALAKNPKAPKEMQELLSRTTEPSVRRALAVGRHVPRELRERLLAELQDTALTRAYEVEVALERLFPVAPIKQRGLVETSPASR